MSEKGGAKPDVAGNRWATTAPPNPITEPLGAKKDVGYALNEKPSSAHFNWLLWINGMADNWLAGSHVREFDDLAEAITATTHSDVFRVGQPIAGNRAYGLQVYSLTPTGYTAIADAASDGEQAYYIDPVGVYAANPDDGSQIWLTGATNITTNAVAADGRSVYVCGDAVTTGLTVINRTTGAVAGVAGTPQFASDIAANGQYAVMADGALLPNNLYYYTVLTSTPVETGLTSHGNPVQACAVDDTKAYWGGVRGGGIDVRANLLATRAAVWTSVINATASPAIYCIETDGELIYVGATRVALGAGNANFYVLQASDGAVIATADVQNGGTDDVTNIAIDGDGIHCTLDGATASVVTMKLGAGGLYQSALLPSVAVAYDADGVGLIASDGAGKVERYFVQRAPVTFERVGTEAARHPFHKLAIPMR